MTMVMRQMTRCAALPRRGGVGGGSGEVGGKPDEGHAERHLQTGDTPPPSALQETSPTALGRPRVGCVRRPSTCVTTAVNVTHGLSHIVGRADHRIGTGAGGVARIALAVRVGRSSAADRLIPAWPSRVA